MLRRVRVMSAEGPGWGSFADISKFRVEMKKAYGRGRGEMRRGLQSQVRRGPRGRWEWV